MLSHRHRSCSLNCRLSQSQWFNYWPTSLSTVKVATRIPILKSLVWLDREQCLDLLFLRLLWLAGCSTSQQHACVSRGWICSDKFMHSHARWNRMISNFYRSIWDICCMWLRRWAMNKQWLSLCQPLVWVPLPCSSENLLHSLRSWKQYYKISSSSAFPATSLVFTILGEIFAYVTLFFLVREINFSYSSYTLARFALSLFIVVLEGVWRQRTTSFSQSVLYTKPAFLEIAFAIVVALVFFLSPSTLCIY